MAEFLYVGLAGGIEEQAVAAADIRLLTLSLATPDSRWRMARFALDLLVGTARCVNRFRRFRPDVLFSTGGFVSLPATLAAWLRRIPVVIFLPDANPGRAVRLTARLARAIAVSTPQTAERLSLASRVRVTGYPVRDDFVGVDRTAARKMEGLEEGDLQVLVTGGSQGSVAINGAVAELLEEVLPVARILHLCGPNHLGALNIVKKRLAPELRARYRLEPSLDGESMARAMYASDIGVVRGGASILGELPIAALPSIVIPLPAAKVGQDINGRVLAQLGGAMLVGQEEAVAGGLRRRLLALLGDAPRRETMRESLMAMRRPRAAQDIATMIVEASGHIAA